MSRTHGKLPKKRIVTLDAVDSAHVFEFKIILQRIKPPIWRRIQVPNNFSFAELHAAIRDSMGWIGYRLYDFKIKDVIISNTSEAESWEKLPEDLKSDKTFIANHFHKQGDKAIYTYDHSDCWEHKLRLAKILPALKYVEYPIVIAGKRACPPEDCGGPRGYKELLQCLANPKNAEHRKKKEWADFHGCGDFDPEKFDKNSVVFGEPIDTDDIFF